jgi:hypothetical protein
LKYLKKTTTGAGIVEYGISNFTAIFPGNLRDRRSMAVKRLLCFSIGPKTTPLADRISLS